MGTKERRQRQMEEREEQFLDAARALIAEHGLLKLQMTRIAEKCEYAVGTLYQHFASKEDLLLALTVQDSREHVELFQRVGRWAASPRERMFAIGVADLVFVKRNPEHFRLKQFVLTEAVWDATSPERRKDYLDAHAPIGDVVGGIIGDAVAAGDLNLHGFTPHQVGIGQWVLSVGTHNLVHAQGVLEEFSGPEPYRLLCRHLQVMLNGYGWLPMANLDDAEALEALIQRIRSEVFGETGPCTG